MISPSHARPDRTRSTRWPTILALLWVAACSDSVTDAPLTNPPIYRTAADWAPLVTLDGRYDEVASLAPAFAGLWLDESGDLVIPITDLSKAADVRAALRSVNADGLDRANEIEAAGRVRFSQVSHTFRNPHRWRDSAYRARVAGRHRVQGRLRRRRADGNDQWHLC